MSKLTKKQVNGRIAFWGFSALLLVASVLGYDELNHGGIHIKAPYVNIDITLASADAEKERLAQLKLSARRHIGKQMSILQEDLKRTGGNVRSVKRLCDGREIDYQDGLTVRCSMPFVSEYIPDEGFSGWSTPEVHILVYVREDLSGTGKNLQIDEYWDTLL